MVLIEPLEPRPGWRLLVPTPRNEWPACTKPPGRGWEHGYERGLSGEARVVPHFVDGETLGIKIVVLRRDSVLGANGHCSGDVITAVNGYPLAPTERALEVFDLLKDERRFTVEFLRDEVPLVSEILVPNRP